MNNYQTVSRNQKIVFFIGKIIFRAGFHCISVTWSTFGGLHDETHFSHGCESIMSVSGDLKEETYIGWQVRDACTERKREREREGGERERERLNHNLHSFLPVEFFNSQSVCHKFAYHLYVPEIVFITVESSSSVADDGQSVCLTFAYNQYT